MRPLIAQAMNFNSRTSCEVRPRRSGEMLILHHFNSRTSCEVRPALRRQLYGIIDISTHAPRVRCDAISELRTGMLRFQLTHLV